MAQIWQTCYSPAHSEVFMRNVATVPLCENPLGRLTKGPDYFPGSNISQSVAHNRSKLLQGVSLGQISLNKEKSHLETSFLIHYLKNIDYAFSICFCEYLYFNFGGSPDFSPNLWCCKSLSLYVQGHSVLIKQSLCVLKKALLFLSLNTELTFSAFIWRNGGTPEYGPLI